MDLARSGVLAWEAQGEMDRESLQLLSKELSDYAAGARCNLVQVVDGFVDHNTLRISGFFSSYE